MVIVILSKEMTYLTLEMIFCVSREETIMFSGTIFCMIIHGKTGMAQHHILMDCRIGALLEIYLQNTPWLKTTNSTMHHLFIHTLLFTKIWVHAEALTF